MEGATGPLDICTAAPLTEPEMGCLCRATAGLACAGGADVTGEDGTPGELPAELDIDPSIVATLDDPVRWDACEAATGRAAAVRFERCVAPGAGGGCSVGLRARSPGYAGALIGLLVAVVGRRRQSSRAAKRRRSAEGLTGSG